MTGLQGKIKGGFAAVAGNRKVGAAEQQDADHFFIAVLRGGVEWGVAALLTNVRVGTMLEEHFDNSAMSTRGGRLNRRGL